DNALQANLPEAVAFLLKRIDSLAAIASDLLHMMNALPPLANVVRYGNVRKADTSLVAHVVSALLARITIGLAPACASLNDDAAWIEGFLKRSGLILLHRHTLSALLDTSISTLPDEQFTAILPFLRRSFSQFPAPERQQMGQRLKSQSGGGASSRRTADADHP